MRKFLLLILPLLFSVCITTAQYKNADENAALQLVSVNRALIGLSADDLNNVKVSSSYLDSKIGVRYVYLQQTFKDIPVYNQIQVLAFKNNILMTNVGGRIADIDKKINVMSGMPAISPEAAVLTALAEKKITTSERAVAINTKEDGRKIEFGKMGVSRENITAQLMWMPSEDGSSIHLAWEVYFIPLTNSDYWLVRVDAKNNYVLNSLNLTVYCNWDDPHHAFDFGTNHNHLINTPKSAFGGNLFDFKTVTKSANQLSTGVTGPNFADNAVYRVIPVPFEAPTFMTAPFHATINNPWTLASANATTLKWHSTDAVGTDYNYSRGNNVWAYEDRSGSPNTPLPSKSVTSTTALPNLTFDFTPDYTLEPTVTTPPNQQFNITNLFYYNNALHDILYDYGFTEAGGNFQFNNLGRGGVGGDHVLAEAQDGGGTNNANFATPVDGGSGRMQMYLWTAPTPDRDGDVDNGIVAHELGHGVSNRSIGGPGNGGGCVSNGESQGEGISDYIGLMTTHRWDTATLNGGLTGRGIGTYALNQAPNGIGIRSQRYSTDFAINNKVYQATLPGAVHDRGEHWCAAAWEVTWSIIQQTGVISPTIYWNGSSTAGNHVAMRIAMQAMRLSPCGSGFIDHRNGWFAADTLFYGGAYSCAIWEGFRKRGMGAFAAQGSAASSADQTPDFTAKSQVVLTGTPPTIPEGQNITYTNTVKTCSYIPITNLLLTDTLPVNVTFVSATAGGTYNGANRVVSWVVNQAALSTATYQFTVTVNAGSFPGNVVMRSSLFDVLAGTRRFNVSQVITPITPVAPGCPNVTSQPANTTVCANSTATFSVTASAANTITYQWQVSTTGPGGPWTNLTNVAPYSGVNTATLTINPTALGLNNNHYRVAMVTIDCPAGVNSNFGILTVVAASIGGTVNPPNTSVCGTTNSGTLTLSGHVGNVIRWESSIVGAGGPYTPIANTTTTLTFTNITQTTWYRAVVQATGCVEANSSVATVTFTASSPIVIVADPGTTICNGDPTRLTVHEGSLTGPVTIPLGAQTGTFTGNVRGYFFTAPANFTMTALRVPTDASTGAQSIAVVRFNPAVPPPAFPGTTNAFTTLFLTQNNAAPGNIPVNIPIVAGDVIGILGQRATVNSYRNAPNPITIAGFPVNLIRMGMQFPLTTTAPQQLWQESAGAISRVFFDYTYGSIGPVATGTFLWTPAAGLSSTTSNPTAASPIVTTTYTVTHNNGAGCIRQANITITVNQRPVVTTQPVSITTCDRSSASFTVGGTGTGLTYQWQVSTTGPGGPWTDLLNVAPYSGVNTATLVINPVALALSGNNYRAVLSGICPGVGTHISNAAVLTVSPLPVVTVTPTTGCGGVAGSNGLLLTASGANNYTWAPLTGLYTNALANIPYTGGNTPTVYAAPTVLTTYTVTGTNTTTGCSNTASAIINYTPPAPTVTPSSVTMCLGDPAVRLVAASTTQFSATATTGTISIPIPDNTATATTSALTISGIPVGATIASVTVALNMPHTYPADMIFNLRAPNGQILNLYKHNTNTDNGPVSIPTAGFYNAVVSSAATTAFVAVPTPYRYGQTAPAGPYRADALNGVTNPGYPIMDPTGFVSNAASFSSLYSIPNGIYTLAMADGGPADLGTLTGWTITINYLIGVPATAATWSPIGGLFNDSLTTIPYAGTARDTVWTRPTPAGVYTYQATVQSLGGPASSIQTTFTNNNQFAMVTSNFRNNNAFPVTITGIESIASTSGASIGTLYFKTTPVNGAPGAISAANGWNVAGTGPYTAIANTTTTTPQPMLSGLSLIVPAGATYGLAFESKTAANVGNLRYSTVAAGSYVNSAGGCDLLSGTNVSYAGDIAPTAPTFTPRAFIGRILFGGASGAPCTSPARTVVVTVNQPVTVTSLPVNQVVCTDKVATFSVTATGSGPITYQWQVSTNNGNTWTNITNGGVYSGATTATLTVTAPPVLMNGYFYRVIINGAVPCGPTTSPVMLLTVNPLPTVLLTPASARLLPGMTVTLTATVTPNAVRPGGYEWLRNGLPAPNANPNSATHVVTIDALGDYTLRVTDINGCTNTSKPSNTVSITDSVSGKCFIYPNPSSGMFQVRYYSSFNNLSPRTLTVYDAKGDRMLTQLYPNGRPYERMDVDMRRFGKGLYWVEIGDVSGNRLTMCRIVIQ